MPNGRVWLEGDFVKSLVRVIKQAGGTSDPIENRKHPGNSDLLYTLNGTMGVIEAKATQHFKAGRKITLRHPLSADQRKFLKAHGSRGAPAYCAVMLSSACVGCSKMLMFSWDQLELLDNHALERCIAEADWAGAWPNYTPHGIGTLITRLSRGTT